MSRGEAGAAGGVLPFRAHTATGSRLDFDFPLHADTGDVAGLAQLVGALLDTLDGAVTGPAPVSNGDVLQALAMTLAVRTTMIAAPHDDCAALARALVDGALEAGAAARTREPPGGHA